MERRQFIKTIGALGIAKLSVAKAYATGKPVSLALSAESGKAHLVGPDQPATNVWTYNGRVPGTVIRTVKGVPLVVDLTNNLDVPTAVHWHGIRLPNAMDGVAGLTQPAVAPGEHFRYEFTPPDSGTYWYHSHVNAYEQVGRGLYGPLIVEEEQAPYVDRDLVWMLDDWRLLKDASISEDFGAGHDRSHAGRIGNVPTVNGRFRDLVQVQHGERIRLRLINASNARNFALRFESLNPRVVAVDGQAIVPYDTSDPIVVGAAGRVDIIIDFTGNPGSSSLVIDSFYGEEFNLTRFVYQKNISRRVKPLESAVVLPPVTLPEPDLKSAHVLKVVIAGGAMGGLREAKFNGQWMSLREIAQQGYVWALNDVIGNKLDMPPLVDVARGRSVLLEIENNTAFPHPMHLHGHHMKLLAIDDRAVSDTRWVDSPLIMPRQRYKLAFVADNPGKWLFHCHALEHHAAGLGALVNVS